MQSAKEVTLTDLFIWELFKEQLYISGHLQDKKDTVH